MTELTQEFLEGLVYDKKAFDERVAYEVGNREGKKENAIEIAKSMLKDKVNPKIILKYTNLTIEEIEKLAKELN